MMQWLSDEYLRTPLYVARSLIKQGDFDSALPWLQKAREVNSADGRIDYHQGIAYEGVGNKELAAKFYQLAMRDRGSDQYRNASRRLRRTAKPDGGYHVTE